MQETVLEGRALHLDVVGKLELALESARRDALIEHLAGVSCLTCFSPLMVSVFSFDLDRQFVLAEAGDGDGDAIVVLAGALDVVGRVARRGFSRSLSSIENSRSKPTVER